MAVQDTFFFSSEVAKKTALKSRRFNNGYHLQLCFYCGDKLDLDYDLINLIHLPIDNIVSILESGKYRIPTLLSFEGVNLPQNKMKHIAGIINTQLELSKAKRDINILKYSKLIKSNTLDFREPLRFFLLAHSETKVMSKVSSNIVDKLKEMNCDIRFSLDHGCFEYEHLITMSNFNPHIVININHINNRYLNDNSFNFVWIQDFFALEQFKTAQIRKNDYFFTLLKVFEEEVSKYNIEYERQSFCINDNIFKLDSSIKREKKIVFVGSSYSSHIDGKYEEVLSELIPFFLSGKTFTSKYIDEIGKKYKIASKFIEEQLVHFIVRDVSVIQLCSMSNDIDYEIEIYGRGWEQYDEVLPFFKGELNYGEDISKVYNSAELAFCPHPLSVLQQRTLEAAGSGAVPIMYDCRDLTDEKYYEEAIHYFKSIDSLKELLTKKVLDTKNYELLLKENSYENFIHKIITKVKKEKQ